MTKDEEIAALKAQVNALREELGFMIEWANNKLKSEITSTDLQPPDYFDGQTLGQTPQQCLAEYREQVIRDFFDKKGIITSVGTLVVDSDDADGSLDIIKSHQIKPIPPKQKKIDHSSLVGSGIDCTYDEGEGEYVNDYHPAHIQYLKSIRMNHPMLISNEQAKRIPIGYTIDIGQCFDDMVAITVTGIKDGYEL